MLCTHLFFLEYIFLNLDPRLLGNSRRLVLESPEVVASRRAYLFMTLSVEVHLPVHSVSQGRN